jgi:uridylate kinase
MTSNQPTQASSTSPSRTNPAHKPFYHRVLLKISGEALAKSGQFGIDGQELKLIAEEIVAAVRTGTQVAVVCGGGNIIRGAKLSAEGYISQATADYMGMLGTVMNGVALKEMLEKIGQPARVLSALSLTAVAEPFIRGRAIRHLEKGRVVIFAAGTGNPFFTTDTAAALRASEIGADVLLKATKVDGIYDKDPNKFSDAKRYDSLSFQQCMEDRFQVMDLTAFSLCMERNIPIVVFDMKTPGHIAAVVRGEPFGTRVSKE